MVNSAFLYFWIQHCRCYPDNWGNNQIQIDACGVCVAQRVSAFDCERYRIVRIEAHAPNRTHRTVRTVSALPYCVKQIFDLSMYYWNV